MTTFRAGQKVRVKPEKQTSIAPYNGEIFTVDRVIEVDGHQKSLFVLWGTKSYNFNVETVEIVLEREVGKEIDDSIVRKGDKLKAVQIIDDVTIYREGVVDYIHYDSWTEEYIFRSKSHTLISFNNAIDYHYILLESGPEPDPVREKLEELAIDAVFEYAHYQVPKLVRKTAEGRFIVYGPYGTHNYDLEGMRQIVGETEIRVLSAV